MEKKAKEKLIQEVIQKQFQMAGHKVVWAEVPEDGLLEIKKKKVYWYEVYKFKDIGQYEEWRKYLVDRLSKHFSGAELDMEVNYIDLRYGMKYTIPKEIKEGEQQVLPF